MHLHFAFFTGKNILYNIFTYVATEPPAGNDKCDDIKNRNNNKKTRIAMISLKLLLVLFTGRLFVLN